MRYDRYGRQSEYGRQGDRAGGYPVPPNQQDYREPGGHHPDDRAEQDWRSAWAGQTGAYGAGYSPEHPYYEQRGTQRGYGAVGFSDSPYGEYTQPYGRRGQNTPNQQYGQGYYPPPRSAYDDYDHDAAQRASRGAQGAYPSQHSGGQWGGQGPYGRGDYEQNPSGRSQYGPASYGPQQPYNRAETNQRYGGPGYGMTGFGQGGYGAGAFIGAPTAERRPDSYRNGPKGYSRSDDRIQDDVAERLMRSDWVDASEVEVKVASGEVTLTGSVCDRSEKFEAERIAESVMGVRDVENRLKIEQSKDRADRDDKPSEREQNARNGANDWSPSVRTSSARQTAPATGAKH